MTCVLVIEDEAALRQTMRRMLEAAGYEVIEAAHGKAGIAAFHAQRPDVVVTDILMPQQEGIETIQLIRATGTTVRIVAISGGGRTHNLDFLPIARKAGADSVLPKPFRREELLQHVMGDAPQG